MTVMKRLTSILVFATVIASATATSIPISDHSFEQISVPDSAGNFVFMPSSPNWTFTGRDGRASGVAKNQSSWGSGGAFGPNYAFIQGTGRIQRTLSGLTPGKSYELSSYLRRNFGNLPEGRANVIVNGQNIGLMRGYDTNWRSYTFRPFVATSTTALLDLVGSEDNEYAFLLDEVSLREEVKSSKVIENGNFNAQPLQNGVWNYEANFLTGGGWSYSRQTGNSGAGLAAIGSPWGSSAFNDNAFGFIQGGGFITQVMKNLVIGQRYAVDFAQRNQTHRIRVFAGDLEILAAGTSSGDWRVRRTAFFTATSSEMMLRFQGVDSGRGDTSLIDGVAVVPEPGTMAILGLGLATFLRKRKAPQA